MATVDHYPGADDELCMRDNNTSAFTDRGWAWGGYWQRAKDYQHFELP